MRVMAQNTDKDDRVTIITRYSLDSLLPAVTNLNITQDILTK